MSKSRDPYNIDCGGRLRLAIEAEGRTVRSFARITLSESDEMDDVKRAENKLTKWLNGENRVPTDYIRRLKPQFGITLEYIFDGDMTGLPAPLRDKIIELTRERG